MLENEEDVVLTCPIPRTGQAVSLIGDKIYLFGGIHDVLKLNDLWTFDIKTNTWTEIKIEGDIPTVMSFYDFINPFFRLEMATP